MTRRDALSTLAEVSATLVQDFDLAGTLVRVVSEASDAVGAAAAGLLVLNGEDQLELLTASSHRAADLEAYQAAVGDGPCVICMDGRGPLVVSVDEVRPPGRCWAR